MVGRRVRTCRRRAASRFCCRLSRRGRTSARRWIGRRTSHPDVVSLIEERFVAVRVDADRRPDINERYNLGGWPTTVFLTSAAICCQRRHVSRRRADDGDAAAGRRRVSRSRRRDSARSAAPSGGSRRAARRSATADHEPRAIPSRISDRSSSSASTRCNGGFGSAPKLPHPHALLFALSLAGDGDSELGDASPA